MDMTQAERAQAVVRFLAKKANCTQFEIGQQLGYTNKSAFSAVLNGKSPVPKSFPLRLASLDPSLNPAFLLGESDEMLLPGHEQPAIAPPPSSTPPPGPQTSNGVWLPIELVRMFTDMSATIRSQQETIRAMLDRDTADTKKGAASI